jgi:hypothetical protein
MTCEECGDVGHSGNNCLTIQEDVNYINNNNNYRPQPNQRMESVESRMESATTKAKLPR